MATPTLLTARTEFAVALNQVCTERGISPQSVLETIKVAILAAYKKDFGLKEDFEYEVEVDPETGAAKLFEYPEDNKKQKKEITPPGFGRIAAQTAKQVILQKIREAEKAAILDEYQEKIGQVITGMVLRFDGKDVVCDIGRGQGRMPLNEQVKGERYKLNQRMAFYIVDIRETFKGKQIIVSRAAKGLVAGLFKREVPEVASKAVEIREIAREPGSRTKIAVFSRQAGVDPVGSCVGQKGVRVQAVINELASEKIDVIQYSEDIEKFIAAALSPAEGLKIEVDKRKKQAKVITPEDQLSLAIGKEGQNVRLAAKLTGYKIDVRGKAEKKKVGKVEKVAKVEKKIKAVKKSKARKTKKTIKGKISNGKQGNAEARKRTKARKDKNSE